MSQVSIAACDLWHQAALCIDSFFFFRIDKQELTYFLYSKSVSYLEWNYSSDSSSHPNIRGSPVLGSYKRCVCVCSVINFILRCQIVLGDVFGLLCKVVFCFSAPTADRLTQAQICEHIGVSSHSARLSNLSHFPAGMHDWDRPSQEGSNLLTACDISQEIWQHTRRYTCACARTHQMLLGESDDTFKLVKSNLRLHYMQTDSCWWVELHHTVSHHERTQIQKCFLCQEAELT